MGSIVHVHTDRQVALAVSIVQMRTTGGGGLGRAKYEAAISADSWLEPACREVECVLNLCSQVSSATSRARSSAYPYCMDVVCGMSLM